MSREHPAPTAGPRYPADERSTRRSVILIGGSVPFAEFVEAAIRGDAGAPNEFVHARSVDDVPLRSLPGACLVVDLGPPGSGLAQLDRALTIAPRAPIVAVTEREDDERGLLALERGAQEHICADDCTTARVIHAVRAADERRRTAMEREAEDAFIAESASLVRAVLDSLDMMAVAIDSDGTIFQVNEPWRRKPPLSPSGERFDVGDNYLERCERLARQGSPELAGLVQGVRSVLARRSARHECDCRVSAEEVEHDLHVIVLPLLGRHGAVVSHTEGAADRAEARPAPLRRLPGPFTQTLAVASTPVSTPIVAYQAEGGAVRRIETLGGLRHEIERALEAGELTLAFQPIVAMTTGRILGAEALLRWRRFGTEWVNPEELVAAAEQSGLIGRLGRWVLESACASLAEIDDRLGKERRLGVSINLSGMQLADPGLPDDVSAALRSTGCDPLAVCLEVTETAIAEDMVAAAANLDTLRRLGVSIALDDFGTGYSSLQYAKHFRVNIVKIDKIFVRELGRGGPDRVIVASVVSLAHGLGALVIAEGVETEEQRRQLTALDCDGVQGFLLSRPLAFDDFVKLCEQEQRWSERATAARA